MLIMDNTTSKIFLEIARRDLVASKILYDKGYYPQAIFLLEQANEKAVKSLYTLKGDVELSRLRKQNIGHNTLNIFRRIAQSALKDVIQIDKPLDAKGQKLADEKIKNKITHGIYDLKIDYNSIYSEWTSAKADSIDRKMHRRKFNMYINKMAYALEEYERTKRSIRKQDFSQLDKDQLRKNLYELYMGVLEHISAQYPDKINDELKKQYVTAIDQDVENAIQALTKTDLLKKSLLTLVEVTSALPLLFYLSVVLQTHATARYPEEDFNPLLFYNKRLPLVRDYNVLYEFCMKSIDMLEQSYKNFN